MGAVRPISTAYLLGYNLLLDGTRGTHDEPAAADGRNRSDAKRVGAGRDSARCLRRDQAGRIAPDTGSAARGAKLQAFHARVRALRESAGGRMPGAGSAGQRRKAGAAAEVLRLWGHQCAAGIQLRGRLGWVGATGGALGAESRAGKTGA